MGQALSRVLRDGTVRREGEQALQLGRRLCCRRPPCRLPCSCLWNTRLWVWRRSALLIKNPTPKLCFLNGQMGRAVADVQARQPRPRRRPRGGGLQARGHFPLAARPGVAYLQHCLPECPKRAPQCNARPRGRRRPAAHAPPLQGVAAAPGCRLPGPPAHPLAPHRRAADGGAGPAAGGACRAGAGWLQGEVGRLRPRLPARACRRPTATALRGRSRGRRWRGWCARGWYAPLAPPTSPSKSCSACWRAAPSAPPSTRCTTRVAP